MAKTAGTAATKTKKSVAAKEKAESFVYATGKRKTAVARASVKPGTGKLTINGRPLETWGTRIFRLWIKEPLMLADEAASKADIDVIVRGGGIPSQAEATRIAIARGLVDLNKDAALKDKFLAYDRGLLVYDFRRTEVHKPSRSRKGARRHKQRSKR
ncbi:MAG: 30S ribosomal protein S9 [Candidatus Aenigmarchaeota archaeon]|nr:30S ribosomal protein S9 [Candidatus Aenigmarchaeota archaeon]